MPKIKEIERTPNPDAMRFVLAEPLTNGVTRSFENSAEAESDELAKALFEIDSVINVYYVDKYITVTQNGKRYGPIFSESWPLQSDRQSLYWMLLKMMKYMRPEKCRNLLIRALFRSIKCWMNRFGLICLQTVAG